MKYPIATSLLGAAWLAATVPSLAQPAAPPPASTGAPAATPADPVALARQRFKEGVQLGRQEQWSKAYEAFLEAWKLNPHPNIALNLGSTEIKLGKHRDAAEHLHFFIENAKDDTNTANVELARERLAEAKKKIATLEISVEGAGVEVRIDGHLIGTSPLSAEVYVEPGKHTIEARKGDARAESTDTYEAGATRTVKLVPKVAAPPPTAAATGPAVGTGAPGESSPGEVDPSGPNRGLVIGGAALSGALLVAGGVFVGLAVSTASKAGGFGSWDSDPCYQAGGFDNPLECDWRHAIHQDAVLFANIAPGMFIGGLVAGSATLLYALQILPPRSRPKGGALLPIPVLTPSSAGVAVTGRF